MGNEPSLFIRIGVAKLIGLAIGVGGFGMTPFVTPEADPWLIWGILLWYPTLGAVIGLAGLLAHSPVLEVPLPWWVRGAGLGAWMNFVLTLFAHAPMRAFLENVFGAGHVFASPFWFVAEGAAVGLLIDYFATRQGGEGRMLLDPPRSR